MQGLHCLIAHLLTTPSAQKVAQPLRTESQQLTLRHAFSMQILAFLQALCCMCRLSMLRMSLAPCAPFVVTNDLMIQAAAMARKHPGVRLHTHLAENQVMPT